MSPELINAIKERLQAKQSKEEIESAVLAMGHTKEVFEAAYTLAEYDLANPATATLPRARTLFVNAWEFVMTRLDLVVLLFIPLALESAATIWSERLPEAERFVNVPFLGLSILTGIVYIVTLTVALRAVTASIEEEKTLPHATRWMVRHVLPLLWVLVLSGLLIFGGLLFFIIPGLIVAISVTFAQYIYVSEDKRGMAALLASRALVGGRWFKVFRKIFGFMILTFIPLFLIGVLYGIVSEMAGDTILVTIGSEFVIQAVSAVLSVMSIHAMYHLYLALKENRGDVTPSDSARVRYLILIGISVASLVAIIVLATLFREKLDWLEEAAVPLETMETSEVPEFFSRFDETALQFANERNGSYVGVCESLRALAEGEGEVVCNDGETAWALQTTNSFGTSFCADSTSPVKVIPAPIENRTKCISVGE
jgi:hypothetical protein